MDGFSLGLVKVMKRSRVPSVNLNADARSSILGCSNNTDLDAAA